MPVRSTLASLLFFLALLALGGVARLLLLASVCRLVSKRLIASLPLLELSTCVTGAAFSTLESRQKSQNAITIQSM